MTKQPSIAGAGDLKQGWINGNPITNSWAGAVMQKPLRIQIGYGTDGLTDGLTDLPTDRPTRQGVESCVRDLKIQMLSTKSCQ